MTYSIRIAFLLFLLFQNIFSFSQTGLHGNSKYIFFLHNRFVQLFDLDRAHPEYGRAEYTEIVDRFKRAGFIVISEKRPRNTETENYARKVVGQIDSLIKRNVKPENITVVGTSMGGYIAQYVSTFLKNPKVNFVFIGCFMDRDTIEIRDIQFCGNILSIYEKTDTLGVSMNNRLKASPLNIPHFKEIELHTNLKHGFLYHPMNEWMQPAIQWARGNYGVLTKTDIQQETDSLLASRMNTPFNGIILIKEKDSIVYSKIQGYADLEKKIPLSANSQFVIGSISKQFTAVLVLLEMEKGNLKLDDKISKYLSGFKQPWKDSISIYHLLTHTHGIISVNAALSFKPGAKTDYERGNNIGYQLLSEIVEKTSRKNFAQLSMELFSKCGLKNTFHPDIKEYKNLVNGYTENEKGRIVFDSSSFQASPAAGTFISTAGDLLIWNECLHNGKLLRPETYKLMTSIQPNVIRQHPVWGLTEYGVGLTIRNKENVVQLGQTGFAPGFASMNFYFPETKTSVVLLQNIIYTGNAIQKFYYHAQVTEMLRTQLKSGKLVAEKNVFAQNSTALPYRLIYPDNEVPGQKYPLLIYLHGMGTRGRDNELPLQKFSLFIIDSLSNKNKFPCFILVPQCPENDVWTLFPHFPTSLATSPEPTPSTKLVLALIHHLIETKDIDPNRIYLTGYSMGGEGTFDLLTREPGLFACGVPLASVSDTSRAKVIRSIPIWVFHGSDDKVNDTKYTRLMMDAIRKQDGHPKYSEIKGVAHDCRNDAYLNKELWQWIFEQHK